MIHAFEILIQNQSIVQVYMYVKGDFALIYMYMYDNKWQKLTSNLHETNKETAPTSWRFSLGTCRIER